MPRRASDLWLLIVAAITASFLWLLAHRSSTIQRGYDVPVSLKGVPERLVITEQSAEAVNIQVLSSAAAHREISSAKLDYEVDVSGAKSGPALYVVDPTLILEQLPRGTQITSRSPASIEVTYERRGRKVVDVRPVVEGEPADGFVLGQVEVNPPQVWLVGARSSVLGLSEVVTETIDVTGIQESVEREVRLDLGARAVWVEEAQPVKVRVQVESEEPLDDEAPPPGAGGTG